MSSRASWYMYGPRLSALASMAPRSMPRGRGAPRPRPANELEPVCKWRTVVLMPSCGGGAGAASELEGANEVALPAPVDMARWEGEVFARVKADPRTPSAAETVV